MKEKILQLLSRLHELEEALANPAAFQDQKAYRQMTQEHAYLSEIKQVSEEISRDEKNLEENKLLLKSEREEEMISLLKEEINALELRLVTLQSKLENLLIPPDPNDSRSVIVEIRAGTGGDEAALFVGDCVRMYQLYADHMKWTHELLSCSESEIGGFKEYIMVLAGHNVKRYLQYEAGTHRVQRVPDTETQGRIHTSAITVAVLLEPTDDEDLVLDEKDLRIDTYRASGAGGQHVNRTDSAVRITHIPTGMVTQCQEERSQHKNKDKAMRLLKAKIADFRQQKREKEESALRASMVGSGDRSERIRTYNFPQNRLTDHRINLTLYNLEGVMKGALEPVSEALIAYFHQQKLQES